jgi:hypothetical protein
MNSDLMGNRTLDLQACGLAPQPTNLQRSYYVVIIQVIIIAIIIKGQSHVIGLPVKCSYCDMFRRSDSVARQHEVIHIFMDTLTSPSVHNTIKV